MSAGRAFSLTSVPSFLVVSRIGAPTTPVVCGPCFGRSHLRVWRWGWAPTVKRRPRGCALRSLWVSRGYVHAVAIKFGGLSAARSRTNVQRHVCCAIVVWLCNKGARGVYRGMTFVLYPPRLRQRLNCALPRLLQATPSATHAPTWAAGDLLLWLSVRSQVLQPPIVGPIFSGIGATWTFVTETAICELFLYFCGFRGL